MHILVIGLNYRTAPVEIREKFVFFEQQKHHALYQLKSMNSILECVILGTCNRTEVYAVVDQLHTGRYFIKAFLSEWFQIPMEEFIHFLYIKENDHALEHLFHVSCGLDSMVIGETQILGQVKDAYQLAQFCQTTGTLFNTLFKNAITLAKRAHTETNIGQNAVSTSYAAIELGKKVFDDLQGKTVLILGAGKMSELTAKHLSSNGVGKVMVANRTWERAVSLAKKFNGTPYHIDDLQEALLQADIVISSTGANGYVIDQAMMAKVMKSRRKKSLFLIDIAVPRDIDPTVNQLDDVYLYDIDDLEGIVESNLQERAREAEKIREMIEVEISSFKVWMDTLGVVPFITELREKLLKQQEAALQNIVRKCPDLTEKQVRMINKQTKNLINQILHDPIICLKEISGKSNSQEALLLFSKMFDLQPEQWSENEKKESIEKSKHTGKSYLSLLGTKNMSPVQ